MHVWTHAWHTNMTHTKTHIGQTYRDNQDTTDKEMHTNAQTGTVLPHYTHRSTYAYARIHIQDKDTRVYACLI